MAKPKFTRLSAAAHFIEGLEDWADENRVEVYPGVIPAGVERYPFVAVETNNVTRTDETKDGGDDYLTYDVTVIVAVKERKNSSGQELAEELANDVIDIMDQTQGEHDGYIVNSCKWGSAAPSYDQDRAAYVVEIGFELDVEPTHAVQPSARLGALVLGVSKLGS